MSHLRMITGCVTGTWKAKIVELDLCLRDIKVDNSQRFLMPSVGTCWVIVIFFKSGVTKFQESTKPVQQYMSKRQDRWKD